MKTIGVGIIGSGGIAQAAHMPGYKALESEGVRIVAVADAVARNEEAFTVVGGADSIYALTEMGFAERVDWASTGGGAALELLEGKELPGVAAIPSA